MAQLNVTELDFDTIKQNLKQFLQGQEEFADYDFDGSGLSILMDILAYNTHYNATLAHLVANEMFIDSAVKRNSVVSIAKTLGYMPTSRRSAVANITLDIVPPVGYTGTSVTITRDSIFTGIGSDATYTFYPKKDHIANLGLTSTGSSGFSFTDIELIEGKRINNSFAVDQSNRSGPFVLPNANIDTTTIRVRVQKSPTEYSIATYNNYENILDIDATTQAFFVEEGASGLHEIRFGDDIIGKMLEVGNIVSVDYIVSSGSGANYVSTFTPTNTFTASGETKTILVSSAATGGAEKQSIDSVRYNAPKINATKNRAVTAEDYASLIKARFSNINSIAVWGGEENNPPIYGKVFISIDPLPGSVITQTDKDLIEREIIKPRSVVSIKPEFVDPIVTYISLNVSVDFDKRITSLTSSRIASEVRTVIDSYFTNNLNKLSKNFYYSDLIRSIVNTTQSIFSATVQIKMHKQEYAFLNSLNDYTISFNTPLEKDTVFSTYFTTVVGGINTEVYVAENSSNTRSSLGTLVLKRVTDDVVVSTNVGTISYADGIITVPQVYITSLSGGQNFIRFYAEPYGNSPNILTTDLTRTSPTSTAPIFPTGARNLVLTLDTSSADITANIPSGINISAVPNY